jgi:hypothetical protein
VLAASEVGPYGAAVIAGVAAVVGGLLTAGSNLGVETLRRRDERSARAERDKRELRQATRLLLTELAEIGQAIRQCAKSHLTWPNDRQLPNFAWREYRAILAAHLPLHAWRWVESAYSEANELNWTVLEVNAAYDRNGATSFGDNEWLRQPFRTVNHAMAELERTLDEPRGAFGYTGYASIEDLEDGVWVPQPAAEVVSEEST